MSPQDLEKLLPYTESLDLPEEQRIEIVTNIWGLMAAVVDQAWGIHSVQLACEQLEISYLQSHNTDSHLKTK